MKLSIRILTLNCFGVPFVRGTRARLATLGRELNDSNLDVICLQEVQLSHYIPLIKRALPSFPHIAFEPFLYAPKGGLLTLSRRPIVDARFNLFRVRGHWSSPAMADWMLHKGMLVTKLQVHYQTVTVVNTHLVANYDADWSRRNRYARHQHAELRQLGNVIKTLDPSELVIVAGDMNFPRGSWLYQELLLGSDLKDPLAESHEPTYRPLLMMPDRYAQALDHLLIRPLPGHSLKTTARLLFKEKLRLMNGKLDYISDHFAIAAHIESTPAD